jgi:LysM repeat protein
MVKQIKTIIFRLSLLLAVISTSIAHAAANKNPAYETTPFDLINAVNALRAAYGLPAYSINSILMFTAQNQADFMAATGNVTHSGPGGSGFTERLLAAGYPLAGDLSLGGFRAENITSGGEGMPAQSAVDGWMGDALHQNTMLSPDLTEIGAGVAVVDGRAYFVIDCARPTTSNAPPAGTSVGSGATVPANAALIYPVVLSTANVAGDVIHEVRSGQTLWQIAISYGVKIDDIKRLNNLFDNNIYPQEKLLIKKESTSTAAPPTETVTPESKVTATPALTRVPTLVTTTTQMPVVPASQNNDAVMTVAIAIIALAILGGGVFTWLGSSWKDNKPS